MDVIYGDKKKYVDDFMNTDLDVTNIARKYNVTEYEVTQYISQNKFYEVITTYLHTTDYSDSIELSTRLFDLVVKGKLDKKDVALFTRRYTKRNPNTTVQDLLNVYDRGMLVAEGLNIVYSLNRLLGVVSLFRSDVKYLKPERKRLGFTKVVNYIMENKEAIQTITREELEEILFNL